MEAEPGLEGPADITAAPGAREARFQVSVEPVKARWRRADGHPSVWCKPLGEPLAGRATAGGGALLP